MSLHIEILIDPSVQSPANADSIHQAVIAAARSRGFHEGEIGIRVTDDETIQRVNQKHLAHDYPTDVISFTYQADVPTIEGELIVSVDTAARRAAELGWNPAHELLLYTVHGVLHLTGLNDKDPDQRLQMRAAESVVMTELGIAQIVDDRVDLESQS